MHALRPMNPEAQADPVAQNDPEPIPPMKGPEGDPNLPTPPVAPVFDRPPEIASNGKKKDIPSGLWIRCKSCNDMVTNKELEDAFRVCPRCDHHFSAGATDRITWLLDEGTFEESDPELSSVDILKFKGVASYADKLKSYQKDTQLRDAVLTGFGSIQRQKVGFAVMDFAFLGASMGSVVGEKITRLFERSTKKRVPVVTVSASGGARMYEGMFSLMQMAKTSAAIARHTQARVSYISILTNPTMAGVMASFASLGDVIIAEPHSMIGFAGARVIRETTREELPKGFQTAEFLLEHGLLDMIVHRKNLKAILGSLLKHVKSPTREK